MSEHYPVLARANIRRAFSRVEKSVGSDANIRRAAGPFSGVTSLVVTVEEICTVAEVGVDEADTATNAGRSKDGDHDVACN